MPDYLDYNYEGTPEDLSYFDELPLWSAPFGLLLLKHVPMRAGMTMIDMGSGAGFPLLELAERLGPGSKCYGLDPWKNANERAAGKIKNYQASNVFIAEGSAEEMPFENNSTDLIVSNLGIHNIDHPEKALAEAHRVLKPGGSLAITTNLYGQWRDFYDIFESTLEALGKPGLRQAIEDHEKARGTVETFTEMLQSAGFHIHKTIEDNFEMRYLDGTAFLNHHFIKLGFLSTWKTIIPQNEWMEVFTALENNLNAFAKEHGELRMEVPMVYLEGRKN